MIGALIYGLVQTEGDILPTILRVALGIVIFPHGAQKLLAWFGGDAYQVTMNYYTKGMASRPSSPSCRSSSSSSAPSR